MSEQEGRFLELSRQSLAALVNTYGPGFLEIAQKRALTEAQVAWLEKFGASLVVGKPFAKGAKPDEPDTPFVVEG